LKSLAQSWHHNNISTKLEIFSTRLASQQHQHEVGNIQHKAGITTLLPLSREVLSDYTKLVLKVFKLYMRQRIGQHICNLFIHDNILEIYGSSLHHIIDLMILDFYLF
jgi:hypothetical protein